jgi:translocator protein
MDIGSVVMLMVFVFVCFLAPAAGIAFPPGAWYESLNKPTWQPPNWLFGPVWTVLYLMIATSGWLIWKKVGFEAAILPFAVFALQLCLNAAWTPIFFGMQRLGFALVVIGLLWVAIVWMIALFRPISSQAALLLLPYLAWVSFATFLNFTLWRLNVA